MAVAGLRTAALLTVALVLCPSAATAQGTPAPGTGEPAPALKTPEAPPPEAPASPASAAKPAPTAGSASPGAGSTVTERDVLLLEEAARRYLEEGDTYRKDVLSMLRREIDRQRKAVDWSYGKETDKLDDVLRERRQDAIRAFESFLARYPNNREYTPEVMFRLAELYFDQSLDDYRRALPDYDVQRRAYDRGKIPDEPKEPEKDFSKSIVTYQNLLARFPQYPLADAAYYALGFCLAETDQPEKSVAVFRQLIEKHPNSQWVPEAWLRVGEYHFELGQSQGDNAEYDKSIAAYQQALTAKDSKYYEMALYKLAWSYFQKYDFPTAIRTFKTLIEHIDTAGKKGGLGSQLRSEAVEYLGVSLAEDDWNGDGEPDPDAGVDRALGFMKEGKPYEREVLVRYADALYGEHDVRKYPQAVAAYRAIIALEPLNPGNAALKETIVGVWDSMGDTEKMTAERTDLVKEYGPGSKWYEANQNHPEVIAKVDRQMELALSQAAQFHHKKAKELRSQAQTSGNAEFGAQALQEYKRAAESYADYLKRFPDTRYSYEMTYYLAECSYYSFEYERAAQIYRKVRDWPGHSEYLEQSAYSAILSIEKEAAKRVVEGRMTEEDVPGKLSAVAEEKMPQTEGKVKVEPLAIPPLTQEWIAAVDDYLGKGLTHPKDPDLPARYSYLVAAEYYKRRHFDEARKRFNDILTKYPTDVVASYSAESIINTYRMENDWENLGLWAKKVEDLKVGKPEERAALQAEVKMFQLGAQFKEAEKAYDKGEYLKAAELFIAVVDQDPKNKLADKGLSNAAMAYQLVHHYDSAAKVYERIATDPLYKDSPFVEGALLQLAENARKFYDFDRAIRSYQALLSRFPRSERAAYAMFTTAELLEVEGKSTEAIRAFEAFSERFPQDEQAGKVIFRSAKIAEKIGNRDEALRLYQRFIRQAGAKADANDRVLESLAHMADIHKQQGNQREWERIARQIISEFAARKMPPDTPSAVYPAKMTFLLIEPKFKEYEVIQFNGSRTEQERAIKRKTELLEQLNKDYSAIVPYKAVDWTMAAAYRGAAIQELFAKALFAAPVPQMSQEEMDILQTRLEDAAKEYQDRAQDLYGRVVAEGRRLKVSNEWTRKALEALNRYRPQEFPLQKEERRAMDFEVRPAPVFEDSL
jgi:TolA-binding protein